jgi:hypothetical protein
VHADGIEFALEFPDLLGKHAVVDFEFLLGEAGEVARHERRPGKRHQVNCRHVIHSLVRKPGAFARCQYKEGLFPQPVFRQAYQRLHQHDEARADRLYVALLELACERGEAAIAETSARCCARAPRPCPTSSPRAWPPRRWRRRAP